MICWNFSPRLFGDRGEHLILSTSIPFLSDFGKAAQPAAQPVIISQTEESN